MPNIVKHTEFKKVVDALWNKVKGTFVTEVNYDTNGSILKYVKNGLETEITKVVTEWKDLEYTTQSSLKNVFDKNTQVEDNKRYYYDRIQENQDWKIARIPCQAGDEFTIIKSDRNDSSQIGLFEASGVHIQSTSATYKLVKGRVVYHLTIPSSVNNVSYFVVSMEKNITNSDEVMVFKENVVDNDIPTNYVPFTDGATVIINSSEVALSFDGTGTNLSSSTVHSAIKELSGKIANAGGGTVTSVNNKQPNDQGEVTVGIADIQGLQGQLDGKVNTTEVGNSANLIPRLNNGKLVDTIIPELAITRIVDATNQADALAKVNSGNIQVGDSVRLTGEQNKVYQYTGGTTGIFTDRFIEISQGDATVKTINNQSPVNGNVTINAGQINGVYNSAGNLQSHLNTIKNSIDTVTSRANNNSNRIGALERKKPTIHVGEIITTFKDNGDSYTLNGVTYLYCGKANNLITSANYPELTAALGLTGVASYNLPVINDIEISYDYTRRARRKHYIVAKIS